MDHSLSSGRAHVSVLSCFPPTVGRDVVVAVVTPLGADMGNPDRRSLLRTDRQVKWTMEVLSYGLTLPLDGDLVKLCVDIYTDWLMALVLHRGSAPSSISREPNRYVQKILRHLSNLFQPRSEQVSPLYLSLCQQVLCAVQSLARESDVMTKDTWETLLHFLLRINHAMLAPPTTAGGVSEQLSRLSMEVLFDVWMQSCSRCFPSRSLWQTGRRMLSSWRHQPAVVDQWNRVTSALTARLLLQIFGPSFPRLRVPNEDAALVPGDLVDQHVSHTWFRVLHLIGNPVDISHQEVVGSHPSSREEAFRDSRLPIIFLRAMRGVSTMVDAFLGLTEINPETPDQRRPPPTGVAVTKSPFKDLLPAHGFSRPRSDSAPPSPINILSLPNAPPSRISPPPHPRRLRPANVSMATSKPPLTFHPTNQWRSPPRPSSSSPLLFSTPRHSPSPLRCNVDSLLHLFGFCLFDAAQIHRDRDGRCDIPVMSERWAAGRAEACGTLCRIFSCKKTGEEILSVYLSRFFLVLLQGLQVSEGACPPVLASILVNSTSLFCCDLRGVNLLFSSFTAALESVLLDRELLRFKRVVNLGDLRRASILILLSVLPLPLQLPYIQSEVLLDGEFSGDDVTACNFLSLKHRLLSVVIGALHTETDPSNTQMILAAMMNLVLDSVLFEAACPTHQETRGGGACRPTAHSNKAAVLWVQFVRLLTQHLTNKWRSDSAVCLSALEVLGGLAKVEVVVEEVERSRALSAVCRYIVFQCGRPPPLHSRDLHSIIVAAFSCLNVWLTRNPTMLDQKDCLLEVLEIVELGISGTKSRQEEEVRSKDKKDLNPASLRVKEAAEATLSCVMQVSGAVPLQRGVLDEEALISSSDLSDSGVRRFRYFLVDSSVIMALLEEPGRPTEVPCPSVTALIRGPSGRHTWTLQLHLQPREGRTLIQKILIPERRRGAQEDAGIRRGIEQQMVPDPTDRALSVRADLSIPALQETLSKEVQQVDCLFQRQLQVEAHPQVKEQSVVMTTCRPPPPVTTFQTARLFLSHLGLLTPETLKDPGPVGVPAQLVSLDSALPGFSEDLRRLDQQTSRTRDSALIFYVKAGQKTAAQILRNVDLRTSVPSHFLDFLSSLGKPVEVGRRQVGGASIGSGFLTVLNDSGGGVFNGERFVLMYADALTEIAFIVPSSSSSSSSSQHDWLKNPAEAESPSNLHSHTEKSPAEDVRSVGFVSALFDSKLLIVWIERFQDIESFPLSELLSEMKTETSPSDVQLVFIHPLQTGLYRICFHGNASSKFGAVLPLVSGSVISRRILGFLVRETVINSCNRRQLEIDSAPLPHVKRKHMINDILQRYRGRRPEPSFYSALFQDP